MADVSFLRQLGLILCCCASLVYRAVFADGGDQSVHIELPASERRILQRALGQGVIGEVRPAPVMADTAGYIALREGMQAYRILAGPGSGRVEQHQRTRLHQDQDHALWRYEMGAGEVGLLDLLRDGNVVMTGIEDFKDKVLTRYSPPEPVLIKDMAPGAETRLRMNVRIHDLNNPDELLHEGSLAVTYRYLGACRVVSRGYEYEALIIKSTYQGNIGPADIDATQYRFFAPHVGIVATVEQRDVSALLFYKTHAEFVKLLNPEDR